METERLTLSTVICQTRDERGPSYTKSFENREDGSKYMENTNLHNLDTAEYTISRVYSPGK